MFAALPSQRLKLIHELVDVLELSIHGRKPDIGDLVQLVQLLHDFFTHNPTFDFTFAHLLDPLFDPVSCSFDGCRADRPFLAGFFHPGEDLGSVERLAATIFLHDDRKILLHSFVRRIATLAPETLAAAADDLAFFGHAGVDHLVFEIIAERTFHRWRLRPLECGLLVGM